MEEDSELSKELIKAALEHAARREKTNFVCSQTFHFGQTGTLWKITLTMGSTAKLEKLN